MPPGINDNDGAGTRRWPSEPDAHGQAALILAESILHTLIENQILTRSEALLAVQTAAEVKVDVAAEIGESIARMDQSLLLLAAIARSLETDMIGEP